MDRKFKLLTMASWNPYGVSDLKFLGFLIRVILISL